MTPALRPAAPERARPRSRQVGGQPGPGVLIQMNSRRAVVSDLSLARWRDDHLDAATPDRLQYFAGGGAVSNDYIDGIHPAQRHH